jgi:hypothetical protein
MVSFRSYTRAASQGWEEHIQIESVGGKGTSIESDG